MTDRFQPDAALRRLLPPERKRPEPKPAPDPWAHPMPETPLRGHP